MFGYIVECDIEYPSHLHDAHSDFPLAPNQLDITYDMLSDFAKAFQICTYKSQKLCQSFLRKERYIVHFSNLQYYVSMGLKITQIHRVIKFRQSRWLESYIDYNTTMRSKGTTDFEKDFYKLMNNSVFGKLMEDIRKRTNVELVVNECRMEKVVASPLYNYHKIINENIVAVAKHQPSIKLDKPVYAGFCVLETSKLLMYEFHYGFIKEKYGLNAQLLFTDTDSLCYHIKTNDLYDDIKGGEWFDFGNYPKDHPLYCNNNNKVIGKMKDETAGVPIVEFVGLRAKLYSILVDDGCVKQAARGIPKRVRDTHSMYKTCLLESKTTYVKFKTITSAQHIVNTSEIVKKSLSPFDDKRKLSADGITSKPYA
jgi:hypothetical protein